MSVHVRNADGYNSHVYDQQAVIHNCLGGATAVLGSINTKYGKLGGALDKSGPHRLTYLTLVIEEGLYLK